MPPRKSDVSKAGTGDEATAAKEALVRDGINIEVYIPIPLSLTRRGEVVRAYNVYSKTRKCILIQLIGSQSAKEYCHQTGERRTATEYTDSGQCHVGNDQERDCLCELSSDSVCLFLPGELGALGGTIPSGTISNEMSSSNEHASASNRKTITPQDVFNALEDLEFPDFRPRLEAELAR